MFTLFSQSRLSESMLTLKMWYVISLLWFFPIKHYLKKEKPLLCSFIFLSHFRLSQNRFIVWRSVLSVVLHFWANALLRFRETCLRYAMLVASTRRGLFAHARVFLHIINNRCLMIPLLPMSLEKVPIPIPMTRGTSFNDCKIVPHVFIALSTFLWRTQQQISKANFWGLTSAPLAKVVFHLSSALLQSQGYVGPGSRSMNKIKV